MSVPNSHLNRLSVVKPTSVVAPPIDCNTDRYAHFSVGEAGTAHVMAHPMLDQGHITPEHRFFGRWLGAHSGAGSEWVHLHRHMAVFELLEVAAAKSHKRVSHFLSVEVA